MAGMLHPPVKDYFIYLQALCHVVFEAAEIRAGGTGWDGNSVKKRRTAQ